MADLNSIMARAHENNIRRYLRILNSKLTLWSVNT